jgi:poly(hydroxyalkanoate) granule-associated protein
MAEKPKATIEDQDMNPFVDAVRKVLLASIGAVALAQEEIDDFVNRLIERGEIAEKDGKKLVNEVMEKRKKKAKKAEGEFNKQMEEVMGKMNVPTKDDIDALSKKVAELSKKVDELKKEA